MRILYKKQNLYKKQINVEIIRNKYCMDIIRIFYATYYYKKMILNCDHNAYLNLAVYKNMLPSYLSFKVHDIVLQLYYNTYELVIYFLALHCNRG